MPLPSLLVSSSMMAIGSRRSYGCQVRNKRELEKLEGDNRHDRAKAAAARELGLSVMGSAHCPCMAMMCLREVGFVSGFGLIIL